MSLVLLRTSYGKIAGRTRPGDNRLFRQAHQISRELDLEQGSRTRLAGDADVATVCVHDLARDVEAKAEAAIVTVRHGALEASEDPFQIGLRYSDSAVLHRQHGKLAGSADPHVDRLSSAVFD